MYPLEIKKKYKTFFVQFINKDKPDIKYLGMLYTAKTETAVRVKIKNYVPNNFIIKRLVEIPHSIYTRLARLYNYREKKKEEEHLERIKNRSNKNSLELVETLNRINRMIENGPYGKGKF